MPEELSRVGREGRELPTPVPRDQIMVPPSGRPANPRFIPFTIYLEHAVPSERQRLWAEAHSLSLAVDRHGLQNLSPEDFCRHILLQHLFPEGFVSVAMVRQRAHRRFVDVNAPEVAAQTAAVDTAVDDAVWFVLHPEAAFDAEAALAAMPPEHRAALAAGEAAVAALPANASMEERAEARKTAAQEALAAAKKAASGEEPADPGPGAN